MNNSRSGIEKRSEIRKRKITGHLAKNFDDADNWDLEFWQNQTPQYRLSALVAIRNDIKKVNASRLK
ncbi:MAG: hypothetical protein HN931_12765 [Desulfobacterales bacterium]|jgi:hypothetical protein|nr:hypothetical protein [Desulfobacteraceae bacterium]MBT4364043.1 hypothetical protein [Desulfobacteraceae bacterium]MBT7087034.1 hypothetical protein [Desulfobacterales bacterium]